MLPARYDDDDDMYVKTGIGIKKNKKCWYAMKLQSKHTVIMGRHKFIYIYIYTHTHTHFVCMYVCIYTCEKHSKYIILKMFMCGHMPIHKPRQMNKWSSVTYQSCHLVVHEYNIHSLIFKIYHFKLFTEKQTGLTSYSNVKVRQDFLRYLTWLVYLRIGPICLNLLHRDRQIYFFLCLYIVTYGLYIVTYGLYIVTYGLYIVTYGSKYKKKKVFIV